MNKVAIYARVSTEEQKERHSIENQIGYAKDFCQKQGVIVHDFYCDNGVSGTIPFEEREAGQRLLDDAKDGKFELVYIWKIDRLARDTRLSLTVAHTLKEIGIGIKSMTEPFDTTTPIGEFMFTQLASIAKLERDNIRERSILGTNRVAREGKWMGGIVAYGYKLDKERYLEINEEPLSNLKVSEAEVVRMIYNWIAKDGLSTIKVAERLNAMNIPPHYTKDGRTFVLPPQNKKGGGVDMPSGKRKVRTSGRWHPHRIGNLIHNCTYRGIHQYGKRSKKPREIIERIVPAIVEEEIWHKAQEVLTNNHLWSKRNSKRNYLLRGLIKCGICGRTLIGSYYKGRKKQYERWYRCNGKSKHIRVATGNEACKLKSVKSEWLENLVWGELKTWILDQESLKKVISKKAKEYEKDKGLWFKKLTGLKDQLASKEEEKSKILRLYRQDIISMKDLEIQFEELEQDTKEIETMYAELKKKVVSDFSKEEFLKSTTEQLAQFKDAVENDHISWEEKRKIVETFVKTVCVNISKDTKSTLLVETIPFRKGIEVNDNLNYGTDEIVDVYIRDADSNSKNINIFQEDTINIIYRFPLPSSEVSSFVIRTGTDSSKPPA